MMLAHAVTAPSSLLDLHQRNKCAGSIPFQHRKILKEGIGSKLLKCWGDFRTQGLTPYWLRTWQEPDGYSTE